VFPGRPNPSPLKQLDVAVADQATRSAEFSKKADELVLMQDNDHNPVCVTNEFVISRARNATRTYGGGLAIPDRSIGCETGFGDQVVAEGQIRPNDGVNGDDASPSACDGTPRSVQMQCAMEEYQITRSGSRP